MKAGTGTGRGAALVLATLACMAAPLSAQDYLGAYQDAQQFQRQLQNMQDNARTGRGEKPAVAGRTGEGKPAPASGLSGFDFAPSPAVTARVNRALADALAGRPSAGQSGAVDAFWQVVGDDPRLRRLLAAQLGGDRARILEVLDTGVLQRRFGERLARHGYSAHNVADVNNAYLIHAWGLVRGPGFDRERVFAAQRERIRQALASGGGPAMADEHKQDFSETLAVLVMLTGAAWTRAGDEGERAVLQEGLVGIGRVMGIDLRRARLTEQGIVAR